MDQRGSGAGRRVRPVGRVFPAGRVFPPGRAAFAVVLCTVLVAPGCAESKNGSGADADSTGNSKRSEGTTTTSSVPTDTSSSPAYAEPGPHAVGVTKLAMADGRSVVVYYPADQAATADKPRATYLQTDGIPADVLAGLPQPPEGTDLTVELPAFQDVPADPDGPFPLVLFSHGSGGWNGVYGLPLSGLASWGYVVASIDFAEYGLLASFGGGSGVDRSALGVVALGAADLLIAESAKPTAVLSGSVDESRIAGLGHSAGAGTMFQLLDDPRISAVIGWAPVPPSAPSTTGTPTMIIAGASDIAITPDEAKQAYDLLQAPKRLVVINDLGHNAFGDSCLAIRSGTDLILLAKDLGLPIPDRLLDLGRNGCGSEDLDTELGWTVIQHLTVAQLRSAFGTDSDPVGLGAGITTAFDGVEMTYEFEEK